MIIKISNNPAKEFQSKELTFKRKTNKQNKDSNGAVSLSDVYIHKWRAKMVVVCVGNGTESEKETKNFTR